MAIFSYFPRRKTISFTRLISPSAFVAKSAYTALFAIFIAVMYGISLSLIAERRGFFNDEALSVFTVEAALYSSLAFANESCAERICSKISFIPSSKETVSSSLEKSSSRLSISEDSLT